jgi:hypothetical protein
MGLSAVRHVGRDFPEDSWKVPRTPPVGVGEDTGLQRACAIVAECGAYNVYIIYMHARVSE